MAGHHLYICGGRVEDDFASKTAERFDTVENEWEKIASMQQAGGCAFGAATERKIFVVGGRDNWELYLKTCDMFNISTNEWQLIGSLKLSSSRRWQYGVSEGNTLCAGWQKSGLAK